MLLHKRCGCLLVLAFVSGCASIPAEAPELSAELSGRISAMESAHNRLLQNHFIEKRRRIDEFIQERWVPEFSREFFNDATIASAWKDIVDSRSDADRTQFILIVAPALQAKINAKRLELQKPLEELEAAISGRLRSEYDNMRAINSTLTAFLHSAAEVEANRKRYLELVGVTDDQIVRLIDEADGAVSDLLEGSTNLDENLQAAKQYQNKIEEIIGKVRK